MREYELYGVVVTEDYYVQSQRLFSNKEKAERLALSIGAELYEQQFANIGELDDYQFSEEWWDNDYRVAVHVLKMKEE